MLTKNKKLTLIISFGSILLLLFVASIAFGHGWGRMNMMGGNNLSNWNTQVPEQYSLNSDQMGKMDTILEEWYNNIMPLNRKLSSLRMEMQGYSNRSDADLGEIKSYRNKVRNLEDEISDIRFKTNKRISDMLSDNQRNYFGSSFDWCDFGLDFEGMNGMQMGNINGMHMGMNDMCMDNWRDCDMHMSGYNNQYSNNGTGCCR